jgi:hypothetical protein
MGYPYRPCTPIARFRLDRQKERFVFLAAGRDMRLSGHVVACPDASICLRGEQTEAITL